MENENKLKNIMLFSLVIDFVIFSFVVTRFFPGWFPALSQKIYAFVLCGGSEAIIETTEFFPQIACVSGNTTQAVSLPLILALNAVLALVPTLLFSLPFRLIGNVTKQNQMSQLPEHDFQSTVESVYQQGSLDGEPLSVEMQAQTAIAKTFFDDFDGDGIPDILQGNPIQTLIGIKDFLVKTGPIREEAMQLIERRKAGTISPSEFEIRLQELSDRVKHG